MAKRINFTAEQWREIKHTKTKDARSKVRLQVLELRGRNKTNKEIADFLGIHPQTVTEIARKYREGGMANIIGNKYTSHNRRLSFDEETNFLEQFRETGEAGQIITVNGIKAKFDELTGKESTPNTIYKLLNRHGWRKVKPRPRHPGAATEEEKDSSKKLTQNGKKYYWKNM